jgi:hypothetical protein
MWTKTRSWGANKHYWWYENENDNSTPFHLINKDSLWLNNVKVHVVQSPDSLYHIYESRMSHAQTSQDAKNLASHVAFDITQQDSVITLPDGFTINSKDKFRNQQVMITVEVPMGKQVQLDDNIDSYSNFSINVQRGRSFTMNVDNDDELGGGDYTMTPSGLQKKHEPAADTTKEKNWQ